jgi:hypothetical protein
MNWDWIVGPVIIIAWLIIVFFILPKMGIST